MENWDERVYEEG